MRIVASFLKFLDRLVDFAGVEIKNAQFKTDSEISWETFRAFLAFLKLIVLFLSLQPCSFGGEFGRGGISDAICAS